MASPTITTQAAFAALMPNYWDRLLGDNLRPNLYLYDLGEKRKLPANFGTTIKIPRIVKQPTASPVIWQSVTEGAATSTCPLSAEFVSGTLVKFRGAYKHSDLVIMTALSDVVQLSLENISYDLARVMDLHVRNQISNAGLALGANLGVKGTAASGSVNTTDYLKPLDLVRIETELETANNPRYPGTNKYAAVIHPRTKYSVISQTSSTFAGWIDVNKYNNAEKIFNGEIGSLMGFKFITSTNIKTSTATLSVAGTSYSKSLFIAPRAYYVTELSEMSARTFLKQLGSAGAADPTNDFATVGAKVFFTAIPGGNRFSSTNSSTEYRMVRLWNALQV